MCVATLNGFVNGALLLADVAWCLSRVVAEVESLFVAQLKVTAARGSGFAAMTSNQKLRFQGSHNRQATGVT